jgi:hypothetical protein
MILRVRVIAVLLGVLGIGALPGCGGGNDCGECFAPYSCSNGLVWEACSCGAPSAPPLTCRLGCGERIYGSCAIELCRETDPKKVGDACSADIDCLPAPPTGDPPNLTNTYLFCDLTSGTCAAGIPPVVADWLAPCSPTVVASIHPGGFSQYGSLADPACGGGLCAFELDAQAACTRHGCTVPCAHSGQCPPGAACLVGGWEQAPYCTAPDLTPSGYCSPRLGSEPALSCH